MAEASRDRLGESPTISGRVVECENDIKDSSTIPVTALNLHTRSESLPISPLRLHHDHHTRPLQEHRGQHQQQQNKLTDLNHSWSHLLPPLQLRDLARDWLREDTPSFDYGGHVVGDAVKEAGLICKGRGVLAGVPFFEAVFRELNCDVTWEGFSDGDVIQPATRIATVKGKINQILLGERPALNCLARCSGVATRCRNLADLALQAGWTGEVTGTRKTTPGFRLVEKYGMLVGGVGTHRYDLSSMVMLKDNHIWSSGNITQAVQAARRCCGFSTKIEAECRSFDEAIEAARAGADCVMLDNFTPETLHVTARRLRVSHTEKLIIEASGGIDETTLPLYLGPDIDVVSMGCISQGYPVIDLSLKVIVQGRDPLNPLVANSTYHK